MNAKYKRPTQDQIDNLCEYLVNGMTLQELQQYVYDDLHHLVNYNPEVFWMNLENLDMDIEDFS